MSRRTRIGCENFQERLKKRGYQGVNITTYIEKASTIDRNEFLKRKEVTEKKSKISFVTTYNKTLASIKPTIEKYWNTLDIN